MDFLANGSTEVTVTPHYKQTQTSGTANCDAVGGLSTTVTMNGCDYRFYDFVTAGGFAETYALKTDIVCPAGKDIEIHIYSGHGHSLQICKRTIKAQTGLTGLHTTNGAKGHINLTGTLTGIRFDRSGLCGSGEFTAAHDLDVTVKAHNTVGFNVGVAISD